MRWCTESIDALQSRLTLEPRDMAMVTFMTKFSTTARQALKGWLAIPFTSGLCAIIANNPLAIINAELIDAHHAMLTDASLSRVAASQNRNLKLAD